MIGFVTGFVRDVRLEILKRKKLYEVAKRLAEMHAEDCKEIEQLRDEIFNLVADNHTLSARVRELENQHVEAASNSRATVDALTAKIEEGEAAIKKLESELGQAKETLKKESEAWAAHHNMYVKAWVRELGGSVIPKTHLIDSLTLTTQKLREEHASFAAKIKIAHDIAAHMERVTLDVMAGTPDLFGPKGGWDEWDEKAKKLLEEFRK